MCSHFVSTTVTTGAKADGRFGEQDFVMGRKLT
jgi:hypothetical protein